MEDLRRKEKHFVNEYFQHVDEKDDFLYGVYEGDAGSLEAVLESYLLLTSASFVRSQAHNKSKNHKRFSNTGKEFLILFENTINFEVRFLERYCGKLTFGRRMAECEHEFTAFYTIIAYIILKA